MIFFSENCFRAFVQPQVIAPHHEHVDIVMLARDASEMQVDCPSAGESRRARAEFPSASRNLK